MRSAKSEMALRRNCRPTYPLVCAELEIPPRADGMPARLTQRARQNHVRRSRRSTSCDRLGRSASAPASGVQFSVAAAREDVELELSPRARDGRGSERDQSALRSSRAADRFEPRPIFTVPPLVQQIAALSPREHVEARRTAAGANRGAGERRGHLRGGIKLVWLGAEAERSERRPIRAVPPLH